MAYLHHLTIVVPPGGTDAVVAFYAEVLGFARIPKKSKSEHVTGAWLQLTPTVQLHLSESDLPPHPSVHFALVVDDLAAVLDKLAARGACWHTQSDVLGSPRGFTIDPAGNRVELIQAADTLPAAAG
ncbi:VOC family protein [Jeongeupia naejangsanensis]|uniref:VOC family protein n=1 Tax=Jeongeupia naejangsanensis TaxID=613195 RepID=A0ABS2BIH8_9NEIS|nr:VOC family protein [Jeongeupia naejangsanensis]MBM3115409.1 VOC family protein [Jeongeupia naejangsanensis]